MIFILFKWLFNKLTNKQLQYVFTHPLVESHFTNLYMQKEQAAAIERRQRAAEELASQPVLEPIQREVVVTRLTQEVYEYLEKQLTNTVVSSSTTELEAGFKLGVQHVLQKLRAGYAIP